MKKWSFEHIRTYLNGDSMESVLARGTASSLSVKTGGAVVGFGAQILLAKLLGATHFGEYAYALAWLNIMVLLAKVGFDTSSVRYVPQYSVRQQWSLLKGLLVRTTQTIIFSSFLVCLVCASLILGFKESFSVDQVSVFWVATLCLPFLALNGLRQSTLRGFKKIFYAEFPDRVFRPLVLMTALGLYALFFGDSLGASQAMLINGGAIAFAFILGSFWLRKIIPDQVKSATPTFDMRIWLKTSVPLFLIAGMHLVLKRTDIIMLGSLSTPEITGIYAATARVSDLVVFALTSVNAIFAPMISEVFHGGRKQDLQSLTTLAARGIFFFTLCVTLVLFFCGRYILGIFGSEFVVGFMPLVILLCGLVINAFVGSVGFLMTMTGNQKQASIIVGLGAVLNVSLNYVLIPRYGMIGAALATALSMVSWNLSMLVFVSRKLGINPSVLGAICRQKT